MSSIIICRLGLVIFFPRHQGPLITQRQGNVVIRPFLSRATNQAPPSTLAQSTQTLACVVKITRLFLAVREEICTSFTGAADNWRSTLLRSLLFNS